MAQPTPTPTPKKPATATPVQQNRGSVGPAKTATPITTLRATQVASQATPPGLAPVASPTPKPPTYNSGDPTLRSFLKVLPYLSALGYGAAGAIGGFGLGGGIPGAIVGGGAGGGFGYGAGVGLENYYNQELNKSNYGGPPVVMTNSQNNNDFNNAMYGIGNPSRQGAVNQALLDEFLKTNPRPDYYPTPKPPPKVTITNAPVGTEVPNPPPANGQPPLTFADIVSIIEASRPAIDPNPLGSANNPFQYSYPPGFDPNAPPNTNTGDSQTEFEQLAKLMQIGKFAPPPPVVDNTQRDQLFKLLQDSQEKIQTLTADFQGLLLKMLTQMQSGSAIPTAALPAAPAGATGNSFPLSNIPAISNMGSNLQFSNAGLGYLNDINPALNRILQQMLATKKYTDTGQAGQYGPLNYARAGGYGSLSFNDADYENPLNYAGVQPTDRESSEAALRMMISKMGLNA